MVKAHIPQITLSKTVHRFDIRLANFDPSSGSEIQKTRPCLVISSDESNEYLHNVIIAPMTTTKKHYPTRVSCVFQSTHGEIALDQIRTFDKDRLIKKLWTMDEKTAKKVCHVLGEMFVW